jgi:hypothetical protein
VGREAVRQTGRLAESRWAERLLDKQAGWQRAGGQRGCKTNRQVGGHQVGMKAVKTERQTV